MSSVKLSKRLQVIHDMVPKSVVADVGADHGKLIISLYEDGIISHGYAIENKKGPYERLVKALTEAGVIDEIVPLLSDGIKDIPPIVDTVVIAGMGGSLIVDILQKSPLKLPQIKTLIVDSHNNVPFLRKKVCDMGFVISDEKIIEEDGIYYEIIKFVRSETQYYEESELEFGPLLSKEKNDVFKAKYQQRIKDIDELLKKNLPEEKVSKLLNEKERINRVL